MPSTDHKGDLTPVPAEQPAPGCADSYWELLAHKLETNPESYSKALETCERWLADGHSGAVQLRKWRELLIAAREDRPGRDRVQQVLRGDAAADERLREFNPFAGVLSREERRRARELCGYRH